MKINTDWNEKLSECLGSLDFKLLVKKIDKEYAEHKICPPREKVFNAFNLCSYDDVNVVILGQDPYFNPGQATGLAFSIELHKYKINNAEKINTTPIPTFPPTLKNIIKEVRSEMGSCAVEDGDLTPWAKQGVLLLNTCLTVREGHCFSHKDIGWDFLINKTIEQLNKKDNIVFILWGSNARKYKTFLTNKNNLVLESAHPSPLSAHGGFFGCEHFRKANEFLTSHSKRAIIF